MSEQIYNWERFWTARDGPGIPLDVNGFLIRSQLLKGTSEFAEIARKPCLILLGEPGIGKSYAVNDAVAYVATSFPADKHVRLDLRSYGDETRLFDALFRTTEIQDWVDGSHNLHLFLDSFDECLLRVDTVASMIAEELRSGKYPIDRLYFRIASRTADFPKSFENALNEIWRAHGPVEAYELCPLQASDVAEAATRNGIRAEDFFAEVVDKKAGTLAARPITLRFLLNIYSKDNHLPERITELYEQGCRVLCDEQDDERRFSPILKDALTADQKLAVAARMAAMMVFCNKIAVWNNPEIGESEDTDILPREASGYAERIDNLDFNVNEEAIRETLQTGLISARGPQRLGWSHQTFAEFLAAWYVARHNLTAEQVLSLITNPTDAEKRITPQLEETAAWICSLRPDVFDEILKTNPLVLLQSDVASFSPAIRARLVDELLKIFSQEKASDWGLNYRRLKHPTLAAQLRPVIKDKKAHYLARRFAIDAAEACEMRELQDDLVVIICDAEEPDYVRANAGYALWKVGDAESRNKIKPLALTGAANDKDERVRGIALLCNWPENMTASEVFSSLVRSPHLIDSYSLFLGRFTEKLAVEDLPLALRWIESSANEFEGDFSIGRVIDEIMLLAWQNITAKDVLPSLAGAALVRLRSFQHDIIDLFHIDRAERYREALADGYRRRLLLQEIAPLINGVKHGLLRISHSAIMRPRNEDLPWLFEQLENATTEDETAVWLQFLGNVYSVWEVPAEAFSLLYEATQRYESVKKYFGDAFIPVELGSAEAAKQRKWYEDLTAPKREMEEELKKNALQPPPKERVLECLNKFEKGEIDFWWHLNLQLTLHPYGRVYTDELEFDLRRLPGWNEADEETQVRIIEAAKIYVVKGDPQNKEWVGTTNVFRPAFAGYRALYLLLVECKDFFDQLSAAVWQKWAAVIVSYPLNSYGGDEMIPHELLVGKAYQYAPEDVIQTIFKQIDAENDGQAIILFPQRLDACWDQQFKNALRNKLDDPKLKTKPWGQLMEELLRHQDRDTQNVAERVVDEYANGGGAKDLALLAAASLMRHADGDSWWSVVWKAIKKDADFGRDLVESVCYQTRPASKLKEKEIAEFFLWLVETFPPAEDPELPMGGAFVVGPRMEIASWRNSFINDLKQRGTQESLAALEEIAAHSDDLEKQLHWTLIEARDQVRRHNWKPLTPMSFLKLIKESGESYLLLTLSAVGRISDQELDKLSWNNKSVAENPALFDFLKVYRARAKEVVFFIGAGLSQPLFPDWIQLLSALVTETSKRVANATREIELRAMLNKGQFLEVADVCARDLGESGYRSFIETQFYKEFTIDDVPRAYALLLSLQPRLILTTNYDRIPEVGGQGKYSPFTKSHLPEAASAIENNRFAVVKLHGCVTQQDSIVFTSTEYQNTYYDPSFKGFVEGLFKFRTVMFLGFGLTDPYFNQVVLGNLIAGNRRIVQGKYALLEGLSQTEIESKLHTYGLNVIPYQRSNDTHPEVLEFMQLLQTLTS